MSLVEGLSLWGYANTGVVWKITKTSASTAPSPTGSHTSNATTTAMPPTGIPGVP
ncbi:MAG TPA: hypothetical protein VI278_18360 [Nitrososphaeraceae archaeon]